MDKEHISKLFQNELNTEIKSVIDKSKGVDQEVKIIETKKEKFVLKIPKDKDKILKEVIATRLCTEKDIPVPKVIFYDENLLIETCIEGTDLDELETYKESFEKIYFHLGQLTKKIHSIRGKGFGSVRNYPLEGNYSSQKAYIESWLFSEIERLERTDHYDKEIIQKIRNFYDKNSKILKTSGSVMLHSDIADNNIVINGDNIAGFIDFGDLSTGPAMQDFAFMYMDHYGDYKFEKLLEGYGEHNLEEIKFYAFCWICWLISSKVVNQEFDNRFNRMEKLLKEILS